MCVGCLCFWQCVQWGYLWVEYFDVGVVEFLVVVECIEGFVVYVLQVLVCEFVVGLGIGFGYCWGVGQVWIDLFGEVVEGGYYL